MPETFSIFYSIVELFSSVLSLLIYVAIAFGLYRMARAIGFANPWMAWIPFCQDYTLGWVADQHSQRNQGKTTTYRKKLLGLHIAIAAIVAVLVVVLIVCVVAVMITGIAGDNYNPDAIMNQPPDLSDDQIATIGLVVLLPLLALLVVYIIYTVFYYIALHKLLKLFAPDSATGFLLLALFIPLAAPILFLVLSKNQPVFTDAQPETVAPNENTETDSWDWNG